MKSVKKFALMCTAVMTATTLIMSSCSDDDPQPIPEITITTQPTAPDELTEGSIPADTKLTTVASVTEGATLTYQWYSNTSESNVDGTAISGATTASYTIPTDLKTATYYYFCEVSAERAESKRTTPVTVIVSAPLADAITLSEQKNVITVGVAGDADYGLSTTGFTIDNSLSFLANMEVKWYTTAEGGAPTDRPDIARGATYDKETSIFSLILGRPAIAGEYYFTITHKDITSNRAKLTVSPSS